MYLEAIKIFCDVVRLKSFSLSAQANGVTQSAASQHVSQLEKTLGVQLIDRSKRPFKVTPEGKVYFEGCREIVERFYEVEAEVKNLRREVSGNIRVAAIYSVGLISMNRAIKEFTQLYPKTSIQMSYLRPENVYDKILADEVDLGLVSCPEKRPGLVALPWQLQPMAVVCNPTHKLASRARLKPDELDGEFFVAFEDGLAIRKEINRYLRKARAEVRIKMAFDNVEAIKRAVEIGEGISILPEATVQKEILDGTLVAIKLSSPSISRPIGIVLREGKTHLLAVERFVEFIQKKDFSEKRSGEEKKAA